MVWAPGRAYMGGEGRQGCDLSPQVSPQHLLHLLSATVRERV